MSSVRANIKNSFLHFECVEQKAVSEVTRRPRFYSDLTGLKHQVLARPSLFSESGDETYCDGEITSVGSDCTTPPRSPQQSVDPPQDPPLVLLPEKEEMQKPQDVEAMAMLDAETMEREAIPTQEQPMLQQLPPQPPMKQQQMKEHMQQQQMKEQMQQQQMQQQMHQQIQQMQQQMQQQMVQMQQMQQQQRRQQMQEQPMQQQQPMQRQQPMQATQQQDAMLQLAMQQQGAQPQQMYVMSTQSMPQGQGVGAAVGFVALAPVPLVTPPAYQGQGASRPPTHGQAVTMMLRNIPNKYTQDQLVKTLEPYLHAIDFVYLPVDFRNHCNLGYAFLNFTFGTVAQRFVADFDGCRLPGYPNSNKVVKVVRARVQGLDNNVRRLRNSSVMELLPDQCKPMLFENGIQVPFPAPDTDPALFGQTMHGGR